DAGRRGRAPSAHALPLGVDVAGISIGLRRARGVNPLKVNQGVDTPRSPGFRNHEELIMTPTRRDFLKTSLATGSLVSWGLTVPTFLSRTARAAAAAGTPGAKETILVVIQLTGGNDGLNTVIPFKDEQYAKLRPTLRIPTAQVKKLNDEVGLHPS